MFPDPKTARILALEHQALVPLFEKMKGLAVLSRAGRLGALADCQQHLEQFRAAYAERSEPSPHTERMLELLNDKLTELAEAISEPQEPGRCSVCASSLQKTGIGTFCETCLDKMLPFYEWLESEHRSFSRTGQSL